MFYSSCPHLLDNITVYSNRTERFNISINGSLCCSGANRTERFNISTNDNLCCLGCSCCVIFKNTKACVDIKFSAHDACLE